MSYTMEDFKRDYVKEHFAKLTPEEQRQALERLSPEQRRQVLQSLPAEERLAGLPVEERLAGLPAEQIRQLLEQLTAGRPAEPRKPRRKK
jgi:Mg/Co/Ni transporter MgtE